MGIPPLLEIKDLRIEFDTFEGISHVLDGIDLSLDPGETLGLVGETGCGKSITAKAVLRLLPVPPARYVSGSIRFRDRDLLKVSEEEIREADTDGNPGMVSCSDQHTTLMRVAKSGGEPVAVAQAPGFADSLLAEPSVYFGGDCLEGISKVSMESQSREPFIQDPTPVWFLESDGEFIYWVTRGDGTIERARR